MGSVDDDRSLVDPAFAPNENCPRIYPQTPTLVDLSSKFAGKLPRFPANSLCSPLPSALDCRAEAELASMCATPIVRRSLVSISRMSGGGDRRSVYRTAQDRLVSLCVVWRAAPLVGSGVCRAARKLPQTKKPITPANNVQNSQRRVVSRWRVDPSATNQMKMPPALS
jgi:hypothetical protein